MPIEVRQLIVRSQVDEGAAPVASVDPRLYEKMRIEILAECKVWFEDRLKQLKER